MLMHVKEYVVQLHGATIDGACTLDEATALKERYVADIMADKLPDLLTSEDFENVEDCRSSLCVAAVLDTGQVIPMKND